MKSITNQKGFAIFVIPLTLAILGLVGTGVIAGIDHEKDLAIKRDIQRTADIITIQNKLADYHSEYQDYPSQKNETLNGQDVLRNALGNIPQDPLSYKGLSYWYWSNSQIYTLRYFKEQTKEEVVIFSQ